MSEDTYFGTMTNPQSQNQYAYVMNNPVNMWDPSGNVPSWVGVSGHTVWTMNSEYGVKLPSHIYSLVDTYTHNSGWYLIDEEKTSKEIIYYYESKRTKEWIYKHSYNYKWSKSPSGNSYSSTDWDTETVTYRDKDYYYKTVVDTAEDRATKNKIEIQRLAGNPPTDENSPAFTISYENDKVINEDAVLLSKRENFNTLSDTEEFAVSSLQHELNKVLGKNLKTDGKYGINTASSIENFQKRYNLPKTGVLDTKTFLQLEEAFREYKVKEFKNNQLMEYEEKMYVDLSGYCKDEIGGASNPYNIVSEKFNSVLRETQINLLELGYNFKNHGADGKWGTTTKTVINDYQSNNGLEITQYLDKETYKSIKEKAEPYMKKRKDEWNNIIEKSNSKLVKTKYDLADPKYYLVFDESDEEYIDPIFAGRLAAFARDNNTVLSINSGYRSYEKQEKLYNDYVNNNGNLAAKPGSSWHNYGEAVDIRNLWVKELYSNTAPTDKQVKLIKYGFFKPLTTGNGVLSDKAERWHFQPLETEGIYNKNIRKSFFKAYSN